MGHSPLPHPYTSVPLCSTFYWLPDDPVHFLLPTLVAQLQPPAMLFPLDACGPRPSFLCIWALKPL